MYMGGDKKLGLSSSGFQLFLKMQMPAFGGSVSLKSSKLLFCRPQTRNSLSYASRLA